MVPRPFTSPSARSSWSSFTALAVGLTEVGCWAPAGATAKTSAKSASAPRIKRMRVRMVMRSLRICSSPLPACGERWAPRAPGEGLLRAPSTLKEPLTPTLSPQAGRGSLHRDGFAVGGLPAPRARAVAALHHPLFVDLGDD